jgi:hypothetical protein
MITIVRRLGALRGATASAVKERLRASFSHKLKMRTWRGGSRDFQYETTWEGRTVTWTVYEVERGGEIEMEVSTPADIDEPSFAAFVDAFLLEVLDASLTGALERFTVRRQFTYLGPPLDGEYWLTGKLRIAPHDTARELRPRDGWVSQSLLIDQEVDAIDEEHAWAIASDRASIITARLSLILDVGIMLPPEQWVWTTTKEGEADGSWRFRCAPDEKRFIGALPGRGSECAPGAWKGELLNGLDGGRKLSLPPETRRVFRFAESAPETIGAAFDGCCRLYQLAKVLPHEFTSAILALKVAAVDALASKVESDGKFETFVAARSPLLKNHPEVLKVLWGSVRSAMFHGGEPYLRDLIRPRGPADFEGARLRDIEVQAETVIRQAIMAWVRSSVAGEVGKPGDAATS